MKYKEDYKKYIIIKNRDRYYLCDIEYIDNNDVILNKIHTLYINKKIRKNRHQQFRIRCNEFDRYIIYQSDIFEEAYKTLESIYIANEFNL